MTANVVVVESPAKAKIRQGAVLTESAADVTAALESILRRRLDDDDVHGHG